MDDTMRIVLLGKTGIGKSSLANTIFGKNVFKVKHFSDSQAVCEAATFGSVSGRHLTVIDTPGFFSPEMSEWELKREIQRSIAECLPGPHAFLIVLRVEKFTEQEMAVIRKIEEYFSAEVFKYSAVVFTCGSQLSEGMKIEAFIKKEKHLKDLVEKCGGRCHVVDNQYWNNNNQQHEYENNRFQVTQLLNTIENMVKGNEGGCYTSKVLKRHIQSTAFLPRVVTFIKRNARRTSVKVFFNVALLIGAYFFYRSFITVAVMIQ